MALSAAQMLDKIQIGNDAGWVLTFHTVDASGRISDEKKLEIGRDDYYAEIRATLPSGLAGGSYTFVIEGITDEHYKKIKESGVVKLFLFWRDVNASFGGYFGGVASLTDTLSGLAGKADPSALVAVLRIRKVSRKAGARHYEATIEAREWVFDQLETRHLCDDDVSATIQQALLLDAARQLAESHHIAVTTLPFTQAAEVASGLEKGDTLVATLNALQRRIEEETNKHGRGIYLIRDGQLMMGNRRFPHEEGANNIKRLTTASGLIETESLERVQIDPNFDACSQTVEVAPSRAQYRLTLKGRPDIKPGSIVEFSPPAEDAPLDTNPGFFGALGEVVREVGAGSILANLQDFDESSAIKLYVTSVEHNLGRKSGFSTLITGLQIDPSNPWDEHSPAHDKKQEAQADEPSPATAVGRVAQAVRQTVQQAMNGQRQAEMGEVRRFNNSGTSEPPSQTHTLWRGLVQGNGEANQARRLAIQRPSPAPINGVPYASPFAWGKCGLVLPRYPGTRVMVVHRNGRRDDPVDVGAVWESGHGPDSQAGDWWLILPVNVTDDLRASVDDQTTPTEHAGAVTQDLIDAAGNRVIEVGELTIRISRNSLKNAGERPSRAADQDSITVEHADGDARIIIKSDGSITIQGKKIELDAGSGDITLKAANVKAQVSGAFDVS